MRKIGILGGTFDPPHIGHLLLGETARQQLNLDLVVFLPAGQPPHKTNEPVTAAEHRLTMTRLATADNPYFVVDTLDIKRAPPHYTSTLHPLVQEAYPGSQLWLLIGGDSLRDLASWHQPQRVIEMWRFGVLPRPGAAFDWAALERDVPGVREVVELLDGPMIDVSSTQIRRWVTCSRSLHYLLAEDVIAYIEAHHLYRSVDYDSPPSSGDAV